MLQKVHSKGSIHYDLWGVAALYVTLVLFIFYLVFYFLFMYHDDEGREVMIFVVCEERKTIKN